MILLQFIVISLKLAVHFSTEWSIEQINWIFLPQYYWIRKLILDDHFEKMSFIEKVSNSEPYFHFSIAIFGDIETSCEQLYAIEWISKWLFTMLSASYLVIITCFWQRVWKHDICKICCIPDHCWVIYFYHHAAYQFFYACTAIM